jgi:predicted lipid carrier protein YhbT
MAAYLSDAWLDQPLDPAAEALAATGGTLTIGRIVSGAPDGEARFTATVADGAVTYQRGLDDSADVTLTDTYANAVAIVRGDLDPNAAFMRGHTKVTGATGQLLDLFSATKSDRFEQARAELLGSVDL